jgi:dTMP kinase
MNRIIVLEGISGSGKGTQSEFIQQYLRSNNVESIITSWNSDIDFSPVINYYKRNRLFTPTLWSMLHATEFSKRYFEVIEKGLNDGKVIIADRYISTAIARDSIRGVDEELVSNFYFYAPPPDLVLYFKLDVNIAFKRRYDRYPSLGYYSSGMDLNLSNDIEESWKIYNTLLDRKYRNILKKYNYKEIDGNLSKEDINHIIKDIINKEFNFDKKEERK